MQKFFLRVSGLSHGLARAAQGLTDGRCRHDVLADAIRAVEETTDVDYVGRGGVPDICGHLTHDGAFMDGNTRAFAGISCVPFLPSKFARLLMEKNLHTSLVGADALRFARDMGITENDFTPTAPKQRAQWKKTIEPLLRRHRIAPESDKPGDIPLIDLVEQIADQAHRHDTVIMLAHDGDGLSAAASTTGWGYKHPGRVGDTPICGAGLYVDTRYGGACCTHAGEMACRDLTAKYIVTRLMDGQTVEQAVMAGIESVKTLKGGVLGSLTLYALDRNGTPCVKAINVQEPVVYYYWNDSMGEPQRRDLATDDYMEIPSMKNSAKGWQGAPGVGKGPKPV